MARFPEIRTWLAVDVQRTADGTYEHVLAKEQGRADVLPLFRTVVSEAHDDARNRLRRLAWGSLDPLAETDAADPADGYPEQLHIQTLKGYFGEVLAGLAAESLHLGSGEEWEVPAHLFRFHLVEFQQLAMMAQTGDDARLRPGRTGDDCLAFRRGAEGQIVAALFCEAKCTSDHDAGMISDAHEKSSLSNPIPVDILQLIDVLEDSADPAAARWVQGLRSLYLQGAQAGYERQDQVTYVCGRSPKRGNRKSWISADKPHDKYCGGRDLHVFELHIDDVERLIKDVYGVR